MSSRRAISETPRSEPSINSDSTSRPRRRECDRRASLSSERYLSSSDTRETACPACNPASKATILGGPLSSAAPTTCSICAGESTIPISRPSGDLSEPVEGPSEPVTLEIGASGLSTFWVRRLLSTGDPATVSLSCVAIDEESCHLGRPSIRPKSNITLADYSPKDNWHWTISSISENFPHIRFLLDTFVESCEGGPAWRMMGYPTWLREGGRVILNLPREARADHHKSGFRLARWGSGRTHQARPDRLRVGLMPKGQISGRRCCGRVAGGVRAVRRGCGRVCLVCRHQR